MATEKQQDKMWDAEEKVNILNNVMNTVEELIKVENK